MGLRFRRPARGRMPGAAETDAVSAAGTAAAHSPAEAALAAAGQVAAATARGPGARPHAGAPAEQHVLQPVGADALAGDSARPLAGDRRPPLRQPQRHAIGDGQLPPQRPRLVGRAGVPFRDRQRRGISGRQGLSRSALEAPGNRGALQGGRRAVLRLVAAEQLLQFERDRHLPDRQLRFVAADAPSA